MSAETNALDSSIAILPSLQVTTGAATCDAESDSESRAHNCDSDHDCRHGHVDLRKSDSESDCMSSNDSGSECGSDKSSSDPNFKTNIDFEGHQMSKASGNCIWLNGKHTALSVKLNAEDQDAHLFLFASSKFIDLPQIIAETKLHEADLSAEWSFPKCSTSNQDVSNVWKDSDENVSSLICFVNNIDRIKFRDYYW